MIWSFGAPTQMKKQPNNLSIQVFQKYTKIAEEERFNTFDQKLTFFWIHLLHFQIICILQSEILIRIIFTFSNFHKLFVIDKNFPNPFYMQVSEVKNIVIRERKQVFFRKNTKRFLKSALELSYIEMNRIFQILKKQKNKTASKRKSSKQTFLIKQKSRWRLIITEIFKYQIAYEFCHIYKYLIYLIQNMFQQSDQVNSTIPKSFSVEKLQSVCYNFSPQFQKIYMGIILGNDYLEIHRGQHLERIMLNDHLTFQILRFHPLQNPHQHSNLNPKFANKNKNTLGNACGLKFQFLNEDKAIQFYFENSDEANLWINKLQNRMNQLNFNREIHIIKKIKNGVQATFYYGQRVQTRERVLVKAYSKERMISENTYENFLQEISTMRIFVQKNWLKFYIIFQSNQAYYILMEEIFANQMISSCNIGSLRGISQNLSSSVSLQNDLNCVAQQVNDIRRQNLRENLSLGRKKSGFQKSTKSFQSIKQHQPLRKLVN